MSVHYPPGYYGHDPNCSVCGVFILDDEDWEGDGRGGARHRMNRGCLRALGRELNQMKEKDGLAHVFGSGGDATVCTCPLGRNHI